MRGRPGTRVGLLLALFAAALALRPQLVGIGPLVPRIQDDLNVSHSVAGLLGTIPVLCMGLFAPPAPHLLRALGTRRAIALALAGIAGFGVARAVAPWTPAVIALTFGVGAGMGLAGALLPIAVKERFADRPGSATGAYATGINLGSALSAALAIPLANALWGWRASLLVFSLATALLLVPWLSLSGGRGHVRPEVRPPRLPVHSRVAWALVAIFALMATVFYGLNSWLPDAYVEHGWSEGSAGGLIALLNGVSVPAAVVVPWLSDRLGSRRAYLSAASGLLTISLLGAILVRDGGWFWAAGMGIALGTQFPLVMTLPLDAAHRPAEVGAVAALMLGAGYSLGALSPLVLGAFRDLTGSFGTSLWLIVGAASLLWAAVLPLSHERLRLAAEAHAA